MDSTYERNVRTIQKSIEQLGFKFSDTRILLGNHAHGPPALASPCKTGKKKESIVARHELTLHSARK
jgi:hypothetical protein